MKKKILIGISILVLIILIIMSYFIVNKMKLNTYIDNTIKYKDQINYSTNIIFSIKSKETSSKVDYDIVRSGNINKLTISNYEDNKLQNSLLKYVVKKGGKKTTYVYNGDTYDKVSGYSEDFNVNYEELKKGKIKKVSKNKYIIKKKSYDAYNMLYNKEVISKEDTDSTIEVTVVIDSKNDFVKEISYEIDDMDNGNMKYKLRLENRDINNHNSIKLPF